MSNSEAHTADQRHHTHHCSASSALKNLGTNVAAIFAERSTKPNSDISVPFPAEQTNFKLNTITPSPASHSSHNRVLAPRLDASSRLCPTNIPHSSSAPSSAPLYIEPEEPVCISSLASLGDAARSLMDSKSAMRSPSKSTSTPLARTPSIKNILANSVGSKSDFGSASNSAFSSPRLNAMADVTPLPSPLMPGNSPGPWGRRDAGHGYHDHVLPVAADAALVTVNGESICSAVANQQKRFSYQSLLSNVNDPALNNLVNKEKSYEGHARNRSQSEYIPETIQVHKSRHVTVTGAHAGLDQLIESATALDVNMRREPHLAAQRGLGPISRPLTPPSSRTGGESSDSDSPLSVAKLARPYKKPRHEYFEAHSRDDLKQRRWRGLKMLGEGTFSKVVLATTDEDRIDEENVPMLGSESIDCRKLVAVKICEHGPRGGASEERVEMSLKRELEIMKSIRHPSLVHLKAWNVEHSRAILVLSYCPGGDLFEVASEHRDLLIPDLLRRMFSELVAAVQYLHDRHIVHRDIKLENVLVNLPHHELSRSQNWSTYPFAIITLTDLGLSRRVTEDEKLTTRCGSDDYAAPEVIMGQPYDGRATDAWSLGVLLYALLESRLPFDPNPGMSEGHKQRSRTSHRIARVEWRWIEFAGDDGEHEGNVQKFRNLGLEGAMYVTEGLLKRARNRWSLERVRETEWVKEAIAVEGGIKWRDEEIPDEEAEDGACNGMSHL